MSKATRRTWRKEQDRMIRQRERTETAAKERRLNGFKPATAGEMLAEVARRGQRASR